MTPTPRTAKAWKKVVKWRNQNETVPDPDHVALMNLAEDIERELAAMTKERDELAICHDTQRDRADAYMEMSDKLKSELAAVTAGRDEALLALGGIQCEIREAFDLDKTPITPDDVRAVCERHAGMGIHTCRANCQRVECVLRRELSAMTAERDRLQRAYDAALRQMNEAIAKVEWLRTDRIAQLERELAEMTAERDEMAALAVSLVLRLPDDTLTSDMREWRDEAKALIVELKAELEDIKKATKAAMDESCDCNERHCSCVPLLRAEIKWLRAITTSFDDELEP